MKKTFSIAVLCLAFAITLSGCGLFSKDKPADKIVKQGENSQQADNQKQEQEEKFFGSMQDLLSKGKSLKCVYKDTTQGSQGEAVMYISGNKARTEIEIKTDTGDIIKSNMVVDNDWMYMWNSLTANGTKIDIKRMPKQANANNNQGVADLSKKIDYKCSAWPPDNSKFVAPSNIVFNDITNIIAGFAADLESPGSAPNSANTKNMCGMCDMIPDKKAKQECRASMNCE